MRILLSSYAFPPSIGGVERQVEMLASGLAARGHAVNVIASRSAGAPTFEHRDGYSVRRVPAGRGSSWQHMATYLGGLITVATPLLRSADLVHVQQILYPAAAMAVACTVARRPLVVTNHGSGQYGAIREMQRLPLGPLALKLIGRKAACISLNAEMTQEMASAGIKRVVRIPNGVQIPLTLRHVPATDPGVVPTVLYVGRLEIEKGVDILIRAWNLLDPAARLVIVGDGRERAALEKLAADGARDSIHFVGAQTDVRPFLEGAELFVLPSRSEGISVALLEAMAFGLPVIATSVGGNREVLGDPGTGILVPPDNSARLASALSDALSTKEGRARMGSAGRAHVARHYSADLMVEAYERLYNAILGT